MVAVLDASALLALLLKEPGKEAVEFVLSEAVISSVNWCEVVQRLIRKGAKTSNLRSDLGALGLSVIAFDVEQAEQTASLLLRGKPYGLSLGDRACIALGSFQSADILTADKIWAEAFPELQIRVIR